MKCAIILIGFQRFDEGTICKISSGPKFYVLVIEKSAKSVTLNCTKIIHQNHPMYGQIQRHESRGSWSLLACRIQIIRF